MTLYPKKFDVLVIGGGHAGVEAAYASSKIGAQTLLLSDNIDTIGSMSCNPAIGGIGKGHLVKEIDALGGIMAKAADASCIHFKILNSSKGHAVRSTRMQTDRWLYKKTVQNILYEAENLTILQQSVVDFSIQNNRINKVTTNLGIEFISKKFILTVGTFLSGKIHIGNINYNGGRAGDK